MPVKPSEIVQRIAGIKVPDAFPQDEVLSWAQVECREGSLRSLVEDFVDKRSEDADPDHVQVVGHGKDFLECMIPYPDDDRESPHPFVAELRFKVYPQSGRVIETSPQ